MLLPRRDNVRRLSRMILAVRRCYFQVGPVHFKEDTLTMEDHVDGKEETRLL